MPDDFAKELSKAFSDAFAQTVHPNARPGTFGLIVTNYVIRKDELEVFEAVTNTITTTAGIGVSLSSEPATNVLSAKISIIAALFTFVRNLRNRGVFLDDEKLALITLLQNNFRQNEPGGMTVSEILEAIASNDVAWNEKKIERNLKELSNYPTPDGSVAELVSEDSFRRWRVVHV